MRIVNKKTLIGGALLMGSFSALYFALPPLTATIYDSSAPGSTDTVKATSTPSSKATEKSKEPEIIVTHLKTPEPLKSLYMTSWVAGDKQWRNSIVRMIDETELNAIVIDVKDYSGGISFKVSNPVLDTIAAQENRIPDIKKFIDELHKKGIYVIARISVFQDPKLVKKHPELAVKRASDGAVWKDYKGISWIDAGARDAWDYVAEIGKESYAVGFDELNFDYIRFPSDGNMRDIAYPWSGKRPKADVLEEFFAYLHDALAPTGAILSADLFGMTTTNVDDLNIGQVLERVAPHFDYVAPMVYPSHYPPKFNGYPNPNLVPYDVVKFSLDRAVARLTASDAAQAGMNAATTSPQKIRPWLQDFQYGGTYGPKEVRAQIQATYDAGLTSWMLWDPAVRYTREVLQNE